MANKKRASEDTVKKTTIKKLKKAITTTTTKKIRTKSAVKPKTAHKLPAKTNGTKVTKKTTKVSARKPTTKTSKTDSPKLLLLDIEGTTTPLSFVADVLFPWVTKHVHKYIQEHYEDDETKKVIAGLVAQAVEDVNSGIVGAVRIDPTDSKTTLIKSVVKNVNWLMSNDRKVGALKSLQGHIWREGYATGELKGDLFLDVLPAFERWREEGKKIYIYSSGSIEAQKLLFGNSVHGDLLPYLDGHFDTSIGNKRESVSYQRIVTEVKQNASEVLFLTDIYAEAEAAAAAGVKCVIMNRPGNKDTTAPVAEKFVFSTATDFNGI